MAKHIKLYKTAIKYLSGYTFNDYSALSNASLNYPSFSSSSPVSDVFDS